MACHISDEYAQWASRGWQFDKSGFLEQLAEFYGEYKHLEQCIHAVQQPEHAFGIDVCHFSFRVFYLFELAETPRACLLVFLKPRVFLTFQ
jgi:hypothetical protein